MLRIGDLHRQYRQAEESLVDARYVGIEHSCTLAEHYARNGSRGVTADVWQRHEVLDA